MGFVGLVGALLFGFYFGVPALFPRMEALVYSSRPVTSEVLAVGAQYEQLVVFGTWLQATGATLCVIFFIGLLFVSASTGTLPAYMVLLGSALLVALVLMEGVFTLTWVISSEAGVVESARAGYDLMSRFIQVFPLVPAPAVYLPLGVILLRRRILPTWLGWMALALGAAFLLVGLLEVFLPLAQAFAAGLAGLQDLWILTAAIILIARPTRNLSAPPA
ncbi:hypothetical protein [Sinomonas sp. ASV322]|uniref:hypothetical protein n=1 Tax=Sinomonas sp. ASV322 TaxID=3041920 RepID=UPI0027DD9F71|nr:hypothetical protein [Sinomonas sp. ASV322]MDQ4503651.1 hypothetical protein [Sinomonas sp. ASV322]